MSINPVQQEILRRVATLPVGLSPIREHAARYATFCSSISTDETLQIAHQPWVGPEAYAIRLFAPAKKAWFARFMERTSCSLPKPYQELLLNLNGCSIHGFDLFGLPPSLQGSTPLLDRSRSQPFDLETANQSWIDEYDIDPGDFHFGSRSWTYEENIGYFWSASGLRAIRTNGEVVGTWPDLIALLQDELPAAEARAAEGVPAEWWH